MLRETQGDPDRVAHVFFIAGSHSASIFKNRVMEMISVTVKEEPRLFFQTRTKFLRKRMHNCVN